MQEYKDGLEACLIKVDQILSADNNHITNSIALDSDIFRCLFEWKFSQIFIISAGADCTWEQRLKIKWPSKKKRAPSIRKK